MGEILYEGGDGLLYLYVEAKSEGLLIEASNANGNTEGFTIDWSEVFDLLQEYAEPILKEYVISRRGER